MTPLNTLSHFRGSFIMSIACYNNAAPLELKIQPTSKGHDIYNFIKAPITFFNSLLPLRGSAFR
jgi:hypothetical protein